MAPADPVFRSLLDEQVDVQILVRGSGGDLAVGSSVAAIPAAVQLGQTARIIRDGAEVDAHGLVFLDADDVTLDPADKDVRVVHAGVSYEVVEVRPVRDHGLARLHHYELAIL